MKILTDHPNGVRVVHYQQSHVYYFDLLVSSTMIPEHLYLYLSKADPSARGQLARISTKEKEKKTR